MRRSIVKLVLVSAFAAVSRPAMAQGPNDVPAAGDSVAVNAVGFAIRPTLDTRPPIALGSVLRFFQPKQAPMLRTALNQTRDRVRMLREPGLSLRGTSRRVFTKHTGVTMYGVGVTIGHKATGVSTRL